MCARLSGLVLGLTLSALCVACRSGPGPASSIPLLVASADTPEQIVVGKMTVLGLRAAGYYVVDETNLDKAWVVRAALEAGSVDIWWEYTGETWSTHLKRDLPMAHPDEFFRHVRELDALNQITWVAMAPVLRREALVMRADVAQRLKITSLSGLARVLNHVDAQLRLCVPEATYRAASGIRGLEQVYQMRFAPERVRFAAIPEGYRALERGECDCALGVTTDPEARAKGLLLLADDRSFFRASNLAVGVRTPLLQQFPALEKDLSALVRPLTQETLGDMVAQVKRGSKPETVARRYLSQNGLLKKE